MSEYKLYCVGESGNCYKVALMLNVCGCDWEPAFVDYFAGETRGDTYRESVNELGEVPVLEHQGRRLTQSGVILTWLADKVGRYGGRDEHERLEILRWMLFDNHKFTSYYATLRFLKGIVKNGDPAVLNSCAAACSAPSASSTSTWRSNRSCSVRSRPSPTSRSPAISTTKKRLASTETPSPTCWRGLAALRTSRDGSILTS